MLNGENLSIKPAATVSAKKPGRRGKNAATGGLLALVLVFALLVLVLLILVLILLVLAAVLIVIHRIDSSFFFRRLPPQG